ncbi:MAG: glycosyl transferase family 1, partial [Bacteroidota bacterium]
MKKVLIISYFFPPCNLTASNRIAGWKKHLPEFGIYPIIVTRNWTGSELTAEERLMDSGSE